jgi:hypothetical protein
MVLLSPTLKPSVCSGSRSCSSWCGADMVTVEREL